MIYLALGSNLGDREWNLEQAKAMLAGALKVDMLCSQVLETEALGFEGGPFLNQAVCFESDIAPEALLDLCQDIEVQLGRPRHAEEYDAEGRRIFRKQREMQVRRRARRLSVHLILEEFQKFGAAFLLPGLHILHGLSVREPEQFRQFIGRNPGLVVIETLQGVELRHDAQVPDVEPSSIVLRSRKSRISIRSNSRGGP